MNPKGICIECGQKAISNKSCHCKKHANKRILLQHYRSILIRQDPRILENIRKEVMRNKK